MPECQRPPLKTEMPNIRYDRINEEVKKTISEIVREMKDPRISPMTSRSSAEVTNDQKLA